MITVEIIRIIEVVCFILAIILPILFLILYLKKMSNKRIVFGVIVCIAYFLLYAGVIKLYPNYLTSLKEDDFAQIHALLQNPGDAAHNFNTQIDSHDEYLENSVTIGQSYENDLLSLTDLIVHKNKTVEDAQEQFHNREFYHYPFWDASEKIYWKSEDGTFEILILSVKREKNETQLPAIHATYYKETVFFRYRNFIVDIQEYTNYPKLNIKDILFFLLENNSNMEFWLTHDISFGINADGTIDENNFKLKGPKRY